MGTAASLLGQCDNQVICLKIPPKKYLESVGKTKDSYVDDFMNELVATAERAGIPIRKEESGISTLLFEFARRYLYKGAQMSGALKRISRVSSEANQTISTLNGDISGMFSAGTASAAEDKTPIPSYLTTVFEAILRITHSFKWMNLKAAQGGSLPTTSSSTRLLASSLPSSVLHYRVLGQKKHADTRFRETWQGKKAPLTKS